MAKPTPANAAAETLALLAERADGARAASYQRFFKEPVCWWGVENKATTRIREELLARVEGEWALKEAVRFCNAMVKDPHMEARGTGFQVVAAFVAEARPELLAQVKAWLEKACGNWGLVDNLSTSVLGPLLAAHPGLIAEMEGWARSANVWVRRGSVVAFVPLVTKKKYLPPAYRQVAALLSAPEDLVHKAMGWVLREAGKIDRNRLEAWLLGLGPALPRTTLRTAIEKFSKEDRARLRAATKG